MKINRIYIFAIIAFTFISIPFIASVDWNEYNEFEITVINLSEDKIGLEVYLFSGNERHRAAKVVSLEGNTSEIIHYKVKDSYHITELHAHASLYNGKISHEKFVYFGSDLVITLDNNVDPSLVKVTVINT